MNAGRVDQVFSELLSEKARAAYEAGKHDLAKRMQTHAYWAYAMDRWMLGIENLEEMAPEVEGDLRELLSYGEETQP